MTYNEFIQNINVQKLPGFPIWSERLCDVDPKEDISQYPTWKQNFIMKNNELYLNNKEFIDQWLIRARQNPLFFGAKAKAFTKLFGLWALRRKKVINL